MLHLFHKIMKRYFIVKFGENAAKSIMKNNFFSFLIKITKKNNFN